MKKYLLNFCTLLASAGMYHAAPAALVPSLADTINLLPGPPCYAPLPIAINSTTRRVYTAGAGNTFGSNGRVSVIDADTNSVIDAFSVPWNVDVIAVNEATNKIYLGTYSGADGSHIAPQITVVDGATDQVAGNFSGSLGVNVLLDPTTGRLFALNGSNPFYVNVYDGTSLSLLATIGLTNGSDNVHGLQMALNPTSRKLYVSDSNDMGRIAVVDLDALTTKPFIHTGTNLVGNLAVDPGTNELFAATVVSNGGNTPTILVINSASDAIVTSIPLTQNDFGSTFGTWAVGVTVDAMRHRAYFSDSNPNPATHVIDTQNHASLGSLPVPFSFGGVLAGSGKLYVTQYDIAVAGTFAKENAVGVIDPTNGDIQTITVGYRPNSVAVDSGRGRLYVADEQARDILTIDVASHAILFRTPTGLNSRDAIVNDEGFRDIAVCESLNRVYATRTTTTDPATFTEANVVDILDEATSTLAGAIIVGTNDYNHARLAVDNARHRLFVSARSNTTSQATLNVYNLDNNALVTTIALPFTANAVAVNPDNGRVYVDGGSGSGGNNVVIINGLTNQIVTILSAGAVPGEIAINRQTNKVYIANNGAGSVDNDVTVINGATDAVETTFNNINSNNGDAVAGVGIDDITNTVYVSDNSNQFDATGRVTIFNPLQNYQFLGQIELGHYPGRMVFDAATRQMFVTNNGSGYISVLGNGVPPPPPAPAHGGLSATVFRVNGKSTASNNVADTVLHFTAQQSGTPAGLIVKVQFNTTPDNNANDWIDLNNGSNGYMTIDQTTGQFVLSSTNYPLANGLYFRALSTAPGYPDSRSNIIGPFNLSATQNHLGTTILYVATNGGGQEMKFRGKVGTEQAGITLRVQSTTSPDDDTSWSDLNDGNSGGMHPFADPKQFYLDTTNYPAGDVIYFRAVATAPGFLNSFSNIIGITHVVTGTPPEVSAFPSTLDQLQPGSGSGTSANDPLILALGSLKFTVQASSPDGKALKAVAMIYDGSTINKSEGNGVSGTLNTDYTTTVPGDHVIKAFATDDRGVSGYADPVYLRILPPSGKVFTMVSSGDWSDAKNWQDRSGQNGVPGGNDVAIVGQSNATISQAITAYAISLLGGSLNGSGGSLTVSGMLSVVSGQLRNVNLTIDSHGTLAIVGDNDVPISGSVNNLGKIKILGAGSIVPVTSTSGSAMRDGNSPLAPAGLFDGIAAFFRNAGDFIFHHPSVKPKPKAPPQSPPVVPAPRGVTAASFDNQGRLITNDGGSIITHDGGSLITNDGGSIIGNDGASLITNDGGSIVSRDGAGLITNDGGSLITNDGGSLLTRPNSTSANFRAATSASEFTQSAGEINLNHLLILGPMTINGGVLRGQGVIAGDLTNNSGFISPGNSAGTITVLGNFAQAADGTLIVENGGPVGGQSDMLQIAGSATLGGRLDIKTIGNYAPDPADTFSPLSYSSVGGSFASVSSNATFTVGATGALSANNINAPQPSSGQPLNIATRLAIESGDNSLFAGFIITGPSGSTKKVLIRGLGPSLANLGVAGTISDPLLELHTPDGTTIANDNWKQAPNSNEIPNGFAPSDERESAIVATLSPGTYTVVLKGANGETGVGLAELYDLESGSAAKLANIATRGVVQTGDNVLIGGFIIGGTEPAKMLVRAIGPSLAAFFPTALAATTLELHDANGSVISNDGWRNTQEEEIIATTIPPTNDNEAAILATLVPGTYTAVVRGRNNATGIAVVEAYNLQ
jgi:DNA-binding beta-propeller fold protein YncE